MKPFNIAQFVLLAASGIGLILLIFTGHPFEKNDAKVVHYKQPAKPKQQIENPPQLITQSQAGAKKLLPEKETEISKEKEEEISVVIKSPQRSQKDDSIGIWKSQPLNESLLIENHSTGKTEKQPPFFVTKRNQTQNISLSQTDDVSNSKLIPYKNKNEKEEAEKKEKWVGLPKQFTSHVRRNSPLYYSGKPSETEYQLDTIGQQLGTLANRSQRQYQQGIRQSAIQVRNLQREMRINKLQQHLDQLKWNQSYQGEENHRSENQQTAQRYFFIGRQRDAIAEKPSQNSLPFLPPKREANAMQVWSPRKIRK